MFRRIRSLALLLLVAFAVILAGGGRPAAAVGGPDLVASVSYQNASPNMVKVTYTITNVGDASTGTIPFYHIVAKTNGEVYYDWSIQPLAPNGGSFSYFFYVAKGYATSGTVTADKGLGAGQSNRVAETDETNNVATRYVA